LLQTLLKKPATSLDRFREKIPGKYTGKKKERRRREGWGTSYTIAQVGDRRQCLECIYNGVGLYTKCNERTEKQG